MASFAANPNEAELAVPRSGTDNNNISSDSVRASSSLQGVSDTIQTRSHEGSIGEGSVVNQLKNGPVAPPHPSGQTSDPPQTQPVNSGAGWALNDERPSMDALLHDHPESEAGADVEPVARPDGVGKRKNTVRFVNDMPNDQFNPVWEHYVESATKEDDEMFRGWNDTINLFLVFAALFSAVLTAFAVVSIGSLQPDNTQTMVSGLVTLSSQLEALSSGASGSYPAFQPGAFTIPQSALWINGLWFGSLVLSLSASVTAILIKSWLLEYTRNLPAAPAERALLRQSRYMALMAWKLPQIIVILPLVIHLAVFLFLAGLVTFMWTLSVLLGALMCLLSMLAAVAYSIVAVLPVVHKACPYKTPVSTFFTFVSLKAFAFVRGFLPSRNWTSDLRWTSLSSDAGNEGACSLHDDVRLHALTWLIQSSSNTAIYQSALQALSGWNLDAWKPRSGLGLKMVLKAVDHKRDRLFYTLIEESLGRNGKFEPVGERVVELAPLCTRNWHRSSLWGSRMDLNCKKEVQELVLHGALNEALSASALFAEDTFFTPLNPEARTWSTHLLQALLGRLSSALEKTQDIPTFAYCLWMDSLSRYWWFEKGQQTEVVRVVTARIQQEFSPLEVLSSSFVLFLRLEGASSSDSNPRPTWSRDIPRLIMKYLQGTDSLGILESVLLCVAHNFERLEPIWEELIIACCKYLDEDADVSEAVRFAAVEALMVIPLHATDPMFDRLLRLSGRLLQRAQEPEGRRYGELVTSTIYYGIRDKIDLSEAPLAQWMEWLRDAGLDYAFEQGHDVALGRTVYMIRHLWWTYLNALEPPGFLRKIEQVFWQHEERLRSLRYGHVAQLWLEEAREGREQAQQSARQES